jgi:hypothetical protein
MEFVILMFLITWKYECDMEKVRRKHEREARRFDRWLENHPYQPGDGAAIAAASIAAAAACCI